MKKSLADGIAEYIKVLIARDKKRQIKIQRAELAEAFDCVPSQVSYVLRTRFREEDGYHTESHRGSQGYILITQFKPIPGAKVNQLTWAESLDELHQKQILNQRETAMLKYIAQRAVANLPPQYGSQVEEEIAAALWQFIKRWSG